MSGLAGRLFGFLIGQDEALNALGGGHPTETLSGTAGRALARGLWWGKPATVAIDAIFGQGHCARQAQIEAARRAADPSDL